jgi:hypothetical protein
VVCPKLQHKPHFLVYTSALRIYPEIAKAGYLRLCVAFLCVYNISHRDSLEVVAVVDLET